MFPLVSPMKNSSNRYAFGIAALVWGAIVSSPVALGGPSSPELRFSIKHDLLVRINRDRARHNLPPVQLDPHASRIADQYCEQQIRHRTTGHFTVDGHAPYMRYSFAGGNDGVSENAAAWSANYEFSETTIPELVRRSQDAMMNERPPKDGHRRTILDPHATHVGIGLAWQQGEFRLAQEFVRRYLTWDRALARAATVGERISGRARPLPGFKVDAISIYHESFPERLHPVAANLIESYGLPRKRRDYLPKLGTIFERQSDGTTQVRYARYRDGRRGDFTVQADGSFAFDVPASEGPGIYTVVVWVRRQSDPRSIPASNISIRVDQPYVGFAAAGGGR